MAASAPHKFGSRRVARVSVTCVGDVCVATGACVAFSFSFSRCSSARRRTPRPARMPRLLWLPPRLSVSALLLCCALPLGRATSVVSCTDTNLECFFFATIGECEQNAAVMHSCPASCTSCSAADGDEKDGAAADDGSTPLVFVLRPGQAHEIIAFSAAIDDPVTSVVAGELHLVMLLRSGAVVTFGDNSMGQLGQPRVARRVPLTRRAPGRVMWPAPHMRARAVAVRAGRFYSGALLDDGALILWGDNTHGQCGVPMERTPIDLAPSELSGLTAVIAVPLRVPLVESVQSFLWARFIR